MGEFYVLAQQLGETLGNRGQGGLFLGFFIVLFWTAEMGAEDYSGAVPGQILDGGQRFPDPFVVGDDAVGQRYVEVAPHEDLLPLDVDVFDGLLVQVIHTVRQSFPMKSGCPARLVCGTGLRAPPAFQSLILLYSPSFCKRKPGCA